MGEEVPLHKILPKNFEICFIVPNKSLGRKGQIIPTENNGRHRGNSQEES